MSPESLSSAAVTDFIANGVPVQLPERVQPPVDPFVLTSPISRPLEYISKEDNCSSEFVFLAGVHNLPLRHVYSEELSSTDPELPACWTDHDLTCVKYIDDCRLLKKSLFLMQHYFTCLAVI